MRVGRRPLNLKKKIARNNKSARELRVILKINEGLKNSDAHQNVKRTFKIIFLNKRKADRKLIRDLEKYLKSDKGILELKELKDEECEKSRKQVISSLFIVKSNSKDKVIDFDPQR